MNSFVRKTLIRALDHDIVQPFVYEARALVSRVSSRAFRPPPGPVYVNLGSGHDRFEGFIGADLFGSGAQLSLDLRKPLPFESGTVSGVFSEHTFEHIPYPQAAPLMAECARVLAPGAWFRVIVPDLSIFVDRYSRDDRNWFAEWERHVLHIRGRTMATKMTAISFVTQEFGHRSCWDFETMRHFLERAGFTEVRHVRFRQGSDPVLLLDRSDPDRTMLSLYVEARKRPLAAQEGR